MDTHYNAIANILIYNVNNKITFEEFILRRNHSFPYEEHNYIRDKIIRKAINNLSHNQLKEKY